MGLLASSVSMTRYRFVEPPPDSLWPEIPKRLKQYSFKDIDQSADERSFGWVNFDDMLDSDWVDAVPDKGEYLAFALRLDTRRISPAVLKKHLQLALQQAEVKARGEGRKYLSRDDKKEVKEQTRLRLLARALPIPALFEVAWNTKTNIVYLASTNSKVRDLFVDLFSATFELHLDPLTPQALALALLGEEAEHRLQNIEPALFIG